MHEFPYRYIYLKRLHTALRILKIFLLFKYAHHIKRQTSEIKQTARTVEKNCNFINYLFMKSRLRTSL